MDSLTIKQFIKHYPFILTKSFYSFIRKYEFLTGPCKYKLNGDLEIYPLIFIFDFYKEIFPKLTILTDVKIAKEEKEKSERIGQVTLSEKTLIYMNYKLISVNQAFSLTKEEFCTEVGIPVSVYDELSVSKWGEKEKPDFPVVNERDLLFFYSKYTYH